jgi:hypothetical protein
LFILDAIADDYEEIDHITEVVSHNGERCGLVVSKEDIVLEVVNVADEGLACAYHLSSVRGEQSRKLSQTPAPSDIRCRYPYFLITEQGKEQLYEMDSEWPFDDNDELRAGWVPPSL